MSNLAHCSRHSPRHRSNKIQAASTPGPGRSARKWSPDPVADRRAHGDSPAHPKRRTLKNLKMSISEQLLAIDAHMISPTAKKRVQ
jgi:hypothetical protein